MHRFMCYTILMDLTSPTIIKKILAAHKAKPSKGLGQNFLINKNILEKIIKSAEIKPDDVILEVGPGIGTLTQELAKRADKVLAVEKDGAMIKILEKTLAGFNNIEVIQGDILRSELQLPEKYKLVANIPYYLTSPLIRKFLENPPAGNQPQEIILMLQKEVAQRICSNPPDMSLLAVSVQFYAEAKIVANVSKNCFWPSPKIDSAIIKIIPKKQKLDVSPDLFFKIVKAGFVQPRKQLASNLSRTLKLDKKLADLWLLRNDIQPNQRAETLSISDWISLTSSF